MRNAPETLTQRSLSLYFRRKDRETYRTGLRPQLSIQITAGIVAKNILIESRRWLFSSKDGLTLIYSGH